MDPLQHPYSKKHLLKSINHLLFHINDKLKPKKKYSYYTYYHHQDRIIEALDRCQEMDEKQKELNAFMNLPVEEAIT